MTLILYNSNISNMRVTNSYSTPGSNIKTLGNIQSILTPTPYNLGTSSYSSPLMLAQQNTKEFHTSAAPFGSEDNIEIVSSLVPIKPKWLTDLEKSQFTLSDELKDITIGLLLGDLYAQKQKLGVNTCLAFRQGIVHEDYLNHLYEKFQEF